MEWGKLENTAGSRLDGLQGSGEDLTSWTV